MIIKIEKATQSLCHPPILLKIENIFSTFNFSLPTYKSTLFIFIEKMFDPHIYISVNRHFTPTLPHNEWHP